MNKRELDKVSIVFMKIAKDRLKKINGLDLDNLNRNINAIRLLWDVGDSLKLSTRWKDTIESILNSFIRKKKLIYDEYSDNKGINPYK